MVTAVGYIQASDLDDIGYPPGDPSPIPSDWVIVHDNVSATPRNVIVPLNSATFTHWIANTNVGLRPNSVPGIGGWSGSVLVAFLVASSVLAHSIARGRRLAVRRRQRS